MTYACIYRDSDEIPTFKLPPGIFIVPTSPGTGPVGVGSEDLKPQK